MKVWSTHRPVSLGTYPKEYGAEAICNFDKREWVEEIRNYAWGYIVFAKDLPKREQDHYDLRPEIDERLNPMLDKAARAMARALRSGDMSRITKILDKAYAKGIIENDEELVEAAQRYVWEEQS